MTPMGRLLPVISLYLRDKILAGKNNSKKGINLFLMLRKTHTLFEFTPTHGINTTYFTLYMTSG